MVKLGTLLGKRLNFGMWVLKGAGVGVVGEVNRPACMVAAAEMAEREKEKVGV